MERHPRNRPDILSVAGLRLGLYTSAPDPTQQSDTLLRPFVHTIGRANRSARTALGRAFNAVGPAIRARAGHPPA